MISVSDETANNVSATYNLRTADELYDEQKDIVYPIIRIKRITRPRKNERWEIIENDEVCLSIKRNTLTNTDANFLCTVDGIKFVLSEFKNGARTAGKLRESLRKFRKQNRG